MLSRLPSVGVFFLCIPLGGALVDPVWAETRTLSATGEYRMGDNDTKTDAKRLALLDAKRLALEQTGTYLESITEVKNLQVTRDDMRSYAAGIVEVTEQATRTALDGETTVVKVDVTVKVDTALVAKQIAELRNNELGKEELIRAREESERLRKELETKSKELAALKGAAADTAVQQRQQVLARADANDLLVKTWNMQSGDRDDLKTSEGTMTESDQAKQQLLLEQALKLDPDNPWVHFKLGHLLQARGDLPGAEHEYRTATRLNPDLARPHLALSRVLLARGSKQEGAEELYMYLLLAKKNPAQKQLVHRANAKLQELERQGVRPAQKRRPLAANERRSMLSR